MELGVLSGIRVLDFARMLAGPWCATLLADFGAEVIRIESPDGAEDRKFGPWAPNGVSLVPLSTSPNKSGITLNLRAEEGQQILKDLVRQSDVVVHNYSPGAKEANLLSYESLKEINPSIIVAAVTAYGQYGPYAQRSAFDNILQAESGAMSYTGFPGNPPTRAAVAYVDVLAGTNGVLGILFALRDRDKTGKGQEVDVCLMDAATSVVLGYAVGAEYRALGTIREPRGNHSFWAYSDTFRAKDSSWIVIVILGNRMWERFLRAWGKEELAEDQKFKDDDSRRLNRENLSSIIAKWMAQKTGEEVIRLLEEAHVPCGRVNNIAEVVQHPQLKAREMVVEMEYPEIGEIPLCGVPIKLSRTPGRIRKRAPLVGEDNEKVYRELLDFNQDKINELKRKGII